jgi:hypothetical protein
LLAYIYTYIITVPGTTQPQLPSNCHHKHSSLLRRAIAKQQQLY